jgi:hypothetical protein
MYDGNMQLIFRNPPSGNSKPMYISLLGHHGIPPDMVKWTSIISKNLSETKESNAHIQGF